jgi:hypothetical protein
MELAWIVEDLSDHEEVRRADYPRSSPFLSHDCQPQHGKRVDPFERDDDFGRTEDVLRKEADGGSALLLREVSLPFVDYVRNRARGLFQCLVENVASYSLYSRGSAAASRLGQSMRLRLYDERPFSRDYDVYLPRAGNLADVVLGFGHKVT